MISEIEARNIQTIEEINEVLVKYSDVLLPKPIWEIAIVKLSKILKNGITLYATKIDNELTPFFKLFTAIYIRLFNVSNYGNYIDLTALDISLDLCKQIKPTEVQKNLLYSKPELLAIFQSLFAIGHHLESKGYYPEKILPLCLEIHGLMQLLDANDPLHLEFELALVKHISSHYSNSRNYRLSSFYASYAYQLAIQLQLDQDQLSQIDFDLAHQQTLCLYELLCKDEDKIRFSISRTQLVTLSKLEYTDAHELLAPLIQLGSYFDSRISVSLKENHSEQYLAIIKEAKQRNLNVDKWPAAVELLENNIHSTSEMSVKRAESIAAYRKQLTDARHSAIQLLQEKQTIPVIQAEWSNAIKSIFTLLCDEVLQQLGRPYGMTFCLLSFGSLSREETCFNSDLEFLILWEKSENFLPADHPKDYFQAFIRLLELKMIALGETNELTDQKVDRIKQRMRRGFQLDEAGNFPFSSIRKSELIGHADLKRPGCLLSLVENATNKINIEALRMRMSTNQTISDSKDLLPVFALLDANYLYGDHALATKFHQARQTLLQTKIIGSNINYGQLLGVDTLKFVLDKGEVDVEKTLNIKDDLLYIPQNIIKGLSVFYGIQETNYLKRIEQLVSQHHLHPHLGLFLRVSIQLAFYWRMRAHEYYHTEDDRLFPDGDLTGFTLETVAEKAYLTFILNEFYPSLQTDIYHWKKNFEKDKSAHFELGATFLQENNHWYSKFYQLFTDLLPHLPWLNPAIAELLTFPIDLSGLRLIHDVTQQRLSEQLFSLNRVDESVVNEPLVAHLHCINAQGELEIIQLDSAVSHQIIHPQTGHLLDIAKNNKDLNRYEHRHIAHLNIVHQGRPIDVYMKEHPDFPMMNYASHLLNLLLCGHGSPANELVLMEIHWNNPSKKPLIYPVLVSQTIAGINLNDALNNHSYPSNQINLIALSQLFICELVKHHGDGFARNYVITPMTTYPEQFQIVCVDLEQMFVRPLSTTDSKKAKLQEINCIYCLPEFQQGGALHESLSQDALYFFAQMNIERLLNCWLDILKVQEAKYRFLLGTRAKDFNQRHKNHPFIPMMAFAEGVVGKLALDLRIIKSLCYEAIHQNKPLPPRALVQQLSGRKIAELYFEPTREGPLQHLLRIANRETTVSSSEYEKYYLGKYKTLAQLSGGHFSIEQASAEISGYTIELGNHPAFLAYPQALSQTDRVVVLDYDIQQTPLAQQKIFIQRWCNPRVSFTKLYIKQCGILDDELLKALLANSMETLTVLSLPKNLTITEKSLNYLADFFPHLTVLIANEIGIVHAATFFNGYTKFQSLQMLYLKNCSNLKTLYLKSDLLEHLDASSNSQLTQIDIDASNLTNGSLANNTVIKRLKMNAKQLSPSFNFNGVPEKLIPNRPLPKAIKKPIPKEIEKPSQDARRKANPSNNDYDEIYPIVLLGEGWTGKTSILEKFIDDKWSESPRGTVGADFRTKIISLEGNKIKLQILDTAGLEKFRTITAAHCRGKIGAVFVFDLIHKQSFDHLWNTFERTLPLLDKNVVSILIGNKCDRVDRREVSASEAQEMAKKINCAYFETSAITGVNINKVFNFLAKEIFIKKHQIDYELYLQQEHPQVWKMLNEFMVVKYDRLVALKILASLNSIQLDQFFIYIPQVSPPKEQWNTQAYLENAKRLIFVAIFEGNMPLAQQVFKLIKSNELAENRIEEKADPLMWRIIASEWCFALQHGLYNTHCDWQDHFFNDEDLVALAPEIAKIPALERINFRNNQIKGLGASLLFEKLRYGTSLQSINLASNQLDDSCVEALVLYLKQSTTIQQLELNDNNFSDTVTLSIAQAIKKNYSLKIFNLSDNRFTYQGLLNLIQEWNYSTPVNLQLDKRLDLSPLWWKVIRQSHKPNQFDIVYHSYQNSTEKEKAFFEDFFRVTLFLFHKYQCPTTEMSVRHIPIARQGAADLSDYLASKQTFSRILLEDNQLTAEHIARICQGLVHNQQLHSLSILNNHCEINACKALASVLPKLTALAYLNLSDNPLTDEGVVIITNALINHPSCLQQLILSNANLTGKCYALIGKLIQTVSSLYHLDLSANPITHINSVLNLLQNRVLPPHLTHLSLGFGALAEKDIELFFQQLNPDNNLKVLKITGNNLNLTVFDILIKLMLQCRNLEKLSIAISIPDQQHSDFIHREFLTILSESQIVDMQLAGDGSKLWKFNDEIQKITTANKNKVKVKNAPAIQGNIQQASAAQLIPKFSSVLQSVDETKSVDSQNDLLKVSIHDVRKLSH